MRLRRSAAVLLLSLVACEGDDAASGAGASGGGAGTTGVATTTSATTGAGTTSTSGSGGAGGGEAADPDTQLAWADEFDGAVGSAPDATVWGFDIGGEGYGNAELQYYTSDADNASLDGTGHLAITALEGGSGHTCWYGPCSHTSARLLTKGKLTQKYGRIEARLRVTKGQGLWPAFWMLGDDIDEAGWPTCGEIDVMENVGFEPGVVHGTLHGPGYSGGSGIGLGFTLPGGAAFGDDFHTFAVEWDPGAVRFYTDGALYQTRTRADLPAGAAWVYDHPFFFILNVAVGGQWPGNPDATTTFPQTMLVDHVRVYRPYRTPFGGNAALVPGQIEAERFDYGGEGVAYHDDDTQNQAGPDRAEEGVDVGPTGDGTGGLSVGYAGPGEWLKYRTLVAQAGDYTLSARVASLGAGGTFHVEANGVDVTGALAAPDTGSWTAYQTMTKSGVSLPAGAVTLRLVLDTAGASGAVANFDWIKVE